MSYIRLNGRCFLWQIHIFGKYPVIRNYVCCRGWQEVWTLLPDCIHMWVNDNACLYLKKNILELKIKKSSCLEDLFRLVKKINKLSHFALESVYINVFGSHGELVKLKRNRYRDLSSMTMQEFNDSLIIIDNDAYNDSGVEHRQKISGWEFRFMLEITPSDLNTLINLDKEGFTLIKHYDDAN